MEVSISEDENGVLIIGFLQNENYDNYVNVQYVDELDEQDIKLGCTKYYIELNEKGAYNCLEKVNMEQYSITFILNNKGKEVFKEEYIKIYNHNLISQKWDALKILIPKVFSEISVIIRD